MTKNNFLGELSSGGQQYQILDLNRIAETIPEVRNIPFAQQVLLENVARNIDGQTIRVEDLHSIVHNQETPRKEISFSPSRVIMQDFTGVPAVVDLATMRDRLKQLGHPTDLINPLVQTDLVIDHSINVDSFGREDSLLINMQHEYQRNRERYQFLRWGQNAFKNFRLVPPATGIVHQINLEYLAQVVMSQTLDDGKLSAYIDTVVGTDSHTTMINGLGVLGWGVGGIEAEAAMLGQPISMLVPEVVGFHLSGQLPEKSTATDLVLTVVEMLRQHGVVGKFVEFYGPGLDSLSLADRATVANMAPEYGATCGLFPVDSQTLDYLALTNRNDTQLRLIEDYFKHQGLWRDDGRDIRWSSQLSLDLGQVEPCISGPARPQDRIELSKAYAVTTDLLDSARPKGERAKQKFEIDGQEHSLSDGSIVIAAITSCTNTSNPHVILGAGLLAQNAQRRGLKVPPWVKTSLATGSRVVTEYLSHSGLLSALEKVGFYVVGYGCTTCIGNSGALRPEVNAAISEGQLNACAVLSGNRNFEGRIHPNVRMNFLASPPLVVAYALAGRIDIDFATTPIGVDDQGKDVFLDDIWPDAKQIAQLNREHINQSIFSQCYQDVFKGDAMWDDLNSGTADVYDWSDSSTYIKRAPYFDRLGEDTNKDFKQLRALAVLGDSITTDHISPAGAITATTPAGEYLQAHKHKPENFNSYGSRRGNHEVMIRGTFANIRLRNQLTPDREGGYTLKFPEKESMSIYDAAMRYQEEGVGLMVIAGKEYGSGSSRDWAAKGTLLLGIRAVVAQSYERIHRSNLIGMGVLPLQFSEGEGADALSLTGHEVFTIEDFSAGAKETVVHAEDPATGSRQSFTVKIRIDTPREWHYYQSKGILPYVLDQLIDNRPTQA